MKNAKVTVIVPVYNVEKYLEECLESIINQTLKELEIICVNDGSIDKSGMILKEYAKKDKRITVIDKVNEGQSIARNKGIEIAEGEFIYFMDSDDYLELDAFEKLYGEAKEYNLDILYFSGIPFWENVKLYESHRNMRNLYTRGDGYDSILSGQDMLALMMEKESYLQSPCLQFIRREYLVENNINFKEGIIHEDNLFTFLLIVNAQRTKCINDIFFHRRIRENSTMTQLETFKNAKGYFTCYYEMLRFLDRYRIENRNVKGITSVMNNVRYQVIRICSIIDKSELSKVYEETGYKGKYIFENIILPELRLKECEKQKNDAQEQEKSMEKLFENMKKSNSYRIGRWITLLPRKIKQIIGK